jgi:hypothetical protein
MSAKRYAVIDGNNVVNVILWDGDADWSPPEGTQTVELGDTAAVGPGFTYDGNAFIAPPKVISPW